MKIMEENNPIKVGIGFRREQAQALIDSLPASLDCLEVAPENLMNTGGKLYRQFCQLAERYPIVFHGISLSVGSLQAIDWDFIKQIKSFVREFNGKWMSDHLCYSSVMGAQFHDLLPLPFTQEAVDHVAPRIRQLQDFFEMPFAIENVSYYAHPGTPEMTEWEFVRNVVEQAQCSLLLDVNNIYVNSINHGFDPQEYLKEMPFDKVVQLHVAGHRQLDDFLLDNHGSDVVDPVWNLLKDVLPKLREATIIVERDNNIPPLSQTMKEVAIARKMLPKALQAFKN